MTTPAIELLFVSHYSSLGGRFDRALTMGDTNRKHCLEVSRENSADP
jgi:hypothetical protein